MSIETEIKIRTDDIDAFCRLLDALKPQVVSGRHFEDNYLLDFPDRRLENGRRLLRIRFAEKRVILTYKGPPDPEGIFKKREELETAVGDGPTALRMLERIGMAVGFRYQKYRREFMLEGVHVAVDETPIGNYVEMEGSEEGIRAVAEKLRVSEAQFIRASYYSLYLDYCRGKNRHPVNMVFGHDG
ncbi:MAG TPA: class IV adenylate cyclase [Acidobacteriota bacterium]|nr:class IV adenylate cyclase [Acidobacteriota bacterium]